MRSIFPKPTVISDNAVQLFDGKVAQYEIQKYIPRNPILSVV
ncbi:MAG TPA: hypothetical protein VFA55_00920 [Candidatus Kapabacteria bacterium]|nr:hypothetical protein [Candidatus Kapabacteria bacterium]